MPSYPRSQKKYNRKNYYVTKPSAKKQYRKYYHQQPSKNMVYVEEPASEEEYSSEEEDEEVYEFNLKDNKKRHQQLESESESESESDSDSDSESDSDIEIDSEDEVYLIDLNDELENEAIEYLAANGKVYDLNDEIVKYYDSESDSSESDSDSSNSSESDSDSDSDSSNSESSDSEYDMEPQDILDMIDMNDQLQAQALRQISGELSSDSESESESESESDSESDVSESETDTDIEYSSDLAQLKDQLLVENVRQAFEEGLVSEDEILLSEDEDEELGSEPEYFELESGDEIYFDDEDIYDAGNPNNYEYDDESSSDSSDDEGVTIYRHTFDLPEYNSDEDSTDEELVSSDEEIYDGEGYLVADDSDDDEIEIIDLSKDLENSKDCELIELDESTYQLNLRFPSLVKEELKIDFLKHENELVIKGKLNFNDVFEEESDFEESEEEQELEGEVILEEGSEEDSEEDSEESEEELEGEVILEEADEEDEEDEDYDVDTTKNDDEPLEWSGFVGQDEDDQAEVDVESEFEEEEEIKEDAEILIKEFKNHEISFEKHFVFDKIIKFDEIKAKFLKNGELELTIPNENNVVDKNDNLFAISIEQDPSSPSDESTTEEIDEAVVTTAPAETDEQFEDASMEAN